MSFRLELQAYDGHMNLILGDVEETILMVDAVDGNLEGKGTVKVSTCSDDQPSRQTDDDG